MENLVDAEHFSLQKFWANKKVFITGNTGFKGSWLTLWLTHLGATVQGLSLPDNGDQRLFRLAKIDEFHETFYGDIRDYEFLEDKVLSFKPDVVLHLAAQPLVRQSYADPLETFSTNLMGTANILNVVRVCGSVKVGVIVTTDKVYKNREWEWAYRENDTLGGHDPYSASKAASELIVDSYRSSYFEQSGVNVSTVRAGNVIGGGDWSSDRLLPDAMKAWFEKSAALEIRSPSSRRPWQHVLDPLNGYLKLAMNMWDDPSLSGAFNFGPCWEEPVRVIDVITQAQVALGRGEVNVLADSGRLHEAGLLSLDSSKSISRIGWKSKYSQRDAITRTVDWYRDFYLQKANARELCEHDLRCFEGII